MFARKKNLVYILKLPDCDRKSLLKQSQLFDVHTTTVLNKVSNHTLSFSKDTQNEYY